MGLKGIFESRIGVNLARQAITAVEATAKSHWMVDLTAPTTGDVAGDSKMDFRAGCGRRLSRLYGCNKDTLVN